VSLDNLRQAHHDHEAIDQTKNLCRRISISFYTKADDDRAIQEYNQALELGLTNDPVVHHNLYLAY